VLIVQHPLAVDPIHFLNNRVAGLQGASYFDLTASRLNTQPARSTALIVYSNYTDRTQINNYPRNTKFCDKWEDVIKLLQATHQGSVRVAVYPYGGIQHQELALDG